MQTKTIELKERVIKNLMKRSKEFKEWIDEKSGRSLERTRKRLKDVQDTREVPEWDVFEDWLKSIPKKLEGDAYFNDIKMKNGDILPIGYVRRNVEGVWQLITYSSADVHVSSNRIIKVGKGSSIYVTQAGEYIQLGYRPAEWDVHP